MIHDFPIKRHRGRTTLIIIGVILILLLLSLSGIVKFITDIEWFKSVGFDDVFWTTFNARILLWIIAFAVGLVIALLNHFIGLGTASRKSDLESESRRQLFWIGLAFSVVIPIVFASLFQSDYWEEYLKATHSQPVGIRDPIFSMDLGYFLFKRPLYIGMINSLLVYIGIITVVTGVLYFITGMILQNRAARIHMGVLVAGLLGMAAYLHKFRVEGIVFSTRGKVFGAGYTDVHVTLPYYRILIGILVISAVLTIVFTIRKKFSLWIFSGVALYLIAAILGGLTGAVVQNYVVSPNEIAKESEYIRYNIEFTKKAFGLNNVMIRDFPDNDSLTPQMLAQNQATLQNIRINDYQAALQTYNQLQGIRRYYAFRGIDVDRYVLDGKLTQVFISARELNKNQVNNTHVNMLYKFTHGMGVGLNAANKVNAEGQPDFLVKDIPPTSKVGIDIAQPRIYYGELTNDAVVVRASIKEFDYPAGDTNAETLYDGKGGVPLGGANRTLFSIRQGSLKMLVSGYINNDSRIMIYRNIHQRVRKIAPFLNYDGDAYITAVDGRLKWILDAYTTSDRYPYSEPLEYNGAVINYIRNPVKVVVDAYDGTVDFYAVDPTEPFIQVYDSIYPGLFKSMDSMPAQLKQHIRYPEDLFSIQTQRYRKYHMTDTTVFYNEEDLWEIATEKYSEENERTVQAYYVVMKIPGEDKEEFVLMRPFTPYNKNNAIAWMAARNDGSSYGELLLYKFPKQKLIYGPMQIENRIDQNPNISRELTLWSQRGSRVIRGNLLMIPIEDTLLYVEPLYIQSDTENALPEVKRIIVGYKDRIVMEDTLQAALEQLFTGAVQPEKPVEGKLTTQELIQKAAEYLQQTKESSGKGDWIEFGKNLQDLEDVIKALEQQNE